MTDQVTETTLSVSWDPVKANIDRYVVRYTSADGESKEFLIGKDQRSTVLTGLRPGVEYKVEVWAQKGARESKKANTEAHTGNGQHNLEVRWLSCRVLISSSDTDDFGDFWKSRVISPTTSFIHHLYFLAACFLRCCTLQTVSKLSG